MEQLKINFKYKDKPRLTGREKELIELMCKGVSPKEAGTRMIPKVDRRTVHYYLRRVKDKLGARTTYQACCIYGSMYPGIGDEIHGSVDGTIPND